MVRAGGAPAAIRAVLDAQVAAWNLGDIDGFMEGYARSSQTAFVSGDEVTHGWQTVRDRYAKKYDGRDKMGRLTFSDLTITLLCDDAAVVLGSWGLERKGDHPAGEVYVALPQASGGLANCAGSYLGGCAAAVRGIRESRFVGP